MSRESVALHVPRAGASAKSVKSGKATWPGTGTRVLLLAGLRETLWLIRNPMVLAGLAISAWLIWLNNRTLYRPLADYGLGQPGFWWAADVSIAACLLSAAGGVLIAGQLAATRVRRDAMEQLYASYPTSAATRTGGHLLSVTGPVVLGAALTAGAVEWLDHAGTLGSPRLWVLAGGLLLICLGGALGVALGCWRQHPMAGILAVLVLGLIEIDLVLSFSNPIHLPDGTAWLFPWSAPGDLLNSLPGLTVPYPPPAHLADLASLIVLATVASLWPVLARRRVAAVLAVAAIGVTCWSGWLEAQPVPASVLGTMAREVTQPGSISAVPANAARPVLLLPGVQAAGPAVGGRRRRSAGATAACQPARSYRPPGLGPRLLRAAAAVVDRTDEQRRGGSIPAGNDRRELPASAGV